MTVNRNWLICVASLVVLSACDNTGGDPPDAPPPPPPPPANTAPVANAGPDQVVNIGATVNLNGAASSDANGTIATYAWTQNSGVAVTLNAAGTATPSFPAPSTPGALGFQLTVTDNGGASHSDTLTVTVNAPPVANAGADQTVSAGAAVSLSGTGTDSDGTIASYAWTQTAGDAVTLSGANTATLAFTGPATAANIAFQLTVTDNNGATHADGAIVTVNAVPPPPPPPPPVQVVVPAIGQHPMNPTAYEHGSALFFVAASGGSLSYEWRRSSGVVVKSGPEPFVLISPLQSHEDGDCYYVVVTNTAGSATSEGGCVTVLPLEQDLDPFADGEGASADDYEYATAFGNVLLKAAQIAAGQVTGPSLAIFPGVTGIITAVPHGLMATNSCYSGSYLGATIDGVALANAALVPLGRHSISLGWDQCRQDSDDVQADNGGMLVEYDFPQRLGEGAFTLYLSDYGYDGSTVNGVIHVTTTAVTGQDVIEITLDEGFSSGAFRAASPQTISIDRRYTSDGMRMDDAWIDLGASLSAYDSEGFAGTVFPDDGEIIRVRENPESSGDNGEPSHISESEYSVGMSGGFHLATLQASYGSQYGWVFEALPPEECPEGQICADPPTP